MEERAEPTGNGRPPGPGGPRREPALNLPAVIVAFAAVLVAIHLARLYLLSVAQDRWAILLFSFIPARYGPSAGEIPVPEAAIWTPLSYALLHSSWMHLLVNLAWMIAFAAPVATRFGPWRTLAFSAACAAGGALAHFVSHPAEPVPMIGASAVVAGFMGAAARFMFDTRRGMRFDAHAPARPLAASLANRQFLIFMGVWFGLNYLFGSGVVHLTGAPSNIAWQAHIGGLVAGLLAFSLLDRR